MSSVLLPRGPRGHVLSGHLPELSGDPLGFLTRCAREYGDIVPLRLGRRPAVLLNRPDLVDAVLVARNRDFIKGSVVGNLRRLLGDGLVTSDGEIWLRERRLTQPAFHRERIADYGDRMAAVAARMIGSWRDGQSCEVYAAMARLTLANVAEALFSTDLGGDAEEVAAALATLSQEQPRGRLGWLLALLPDWVPIPRNRKVRAAVQRLDAVAAALVQRRRADGRPTDDLLGLLLRGKEEGGNGTSDRQVRDEVLTFLLAGHDTTALLLTWTWYLLSGHPEAERTLLAELRAELGYRSPGTAALPRLHYTESVILEALRLYPPSWLLARVAVRDCEISGLTVPAGTIVLMSQWVLHRDPRYYERPATFAPERWAGSLAKDLPRGAYFPFGLGPRACIGNTFALQEAMLLLATIALSFRVDIMPGQEATPRPDIVLRPDSTIRAVLRQR